MTYPLKEEHLTNWDALKSRQSSIVSLRENNLLSIPNNKHLLTSLSPRTNLPQKEPHTLRDLHNDLPEKVPPGQGNLVPLPETKPHAMHENYYPYWHYYKLKTPDGNMHHCQTTDDQQRYETVEKVSPSSPPISHENYKQQTSPPKQYTPVEDADNIEHLDRSSRQRSSQ
ncbi:unnamed protein product [Rotaria sordida]|uniref:Uncharacterized protein n=1 Tax=Rotaria sordida TaxID=392033 RepID=A0A819PU99_9BILA|nr:unnamed protein product [Rotaria sordida]